MDLNHDTGGTVEGWAHVVQSIQTILSTWLNSREFQREFGSDVASLIDAPMNEAGVLALYVAVAVAIDRWEPRFDLTDVQVEGAATGIITLTLTGVYRPNAHRGDLDTVSGEAQVVRVLRDRLDNWSVAA